MIFKPSSLYHLLLLILTVASSPISLSKLDETYAGQYKKIWLNQDFILPDAEKETRTFRALKLNNDLLVMIVSDNSTDRAGYSISVNSGSMVERDDLNGLAHFLEHMLFLGTKKYPDPGAYLDYIERAGGGRNAYTAPSQTNYFFEVNSDYIFEGIERMTDFFVDPIFNVNSVQRELMNINSEHRKNIKDDGRRINSVIKQLSNHPYNKFATGDLMTLKYLPELNGISVRDEMIKYYQQFYSSNIMTACIFAKDDIETLTKTAIEYLRTPLMAD